MSYMASDLRELIERLEKATGPDRELDRDIHWIGAMRYIPNGGDSFLDPQTGLASTFKVGGSPHYTASIDSALTLVPEGWRAILYTENGCAELYPTIGVKRPTGIRSRAEGATLAIGIVIAALRARSQEPE